MKYLFFSKIYLLIFLISFSSNNYPRSTRVLPQLKWPRFDHSGVGLVGVGEGRQTIRGIDLNLKIVVWLGLMTLGVNIEN